MPNYKARRETVAATGFQLELTPGPENVAMKSAQATSAKMWSVPIDQIELIDRFNVRTTDRPEYIRHIEQLADSIVKDGYYQDKPLSGYVHKMDDGTTCIKLIDGHCRLAAVKLAISRGLDGLTHLPMVMKPPGTSVEDLTVVLDRSNSALPLTVYEKALVCQRMINFGNSVEQVASRLGYSEKYVGDLLALLTVPTQVLKLVKTGEVPAALAVKHAKRYGSKATEILTQGLANAKKQGKERMTEKHIPAALRKAPTTRKTQSPSNIVSDSHFYRSAIDYSISQIKGAIGGQGWLKDFMAGDPMAIAELEAYMHQRPGSFSDPALRGPVKANGIHRAPGRVDVDDL